MALIESKLKDYKEHYQVEWANGITDDILPEDVLVPMGEEFYRLLKSKDKMQVDDWKTHKELYPNADYEKENRGRASGLSLLKKVRSKDRKYFAKNEKNKREGLAKITLNPEDGVVKQTGENKRHYTLWPTTTFDPIRKAERIDSDET